VRFLVRHPDLVPSAEGEVSEPLLLE